MKVNLIVMSFFVLISSILPGCGGGGGGSGNGQGDERSEVGVRYSVEVEVPDELSGVVVGAGSYSDGTVVVLKATPNVGYQFVNWQEGNDTLSTSSTLQFSLDKDRRIIANFEPIDSCETTDGIENDFEYSWSLATEMVTIKNNNQCDSIFIWATSTPLCTGCVNQIYTAFKRVLPGDSVAIRAGVPPYLSWKPSLIYSNDKGETFEFNPDYGVKHSQILLLDYSDYHVAKIEEFAKAFRVDDREDVRGDCYGFNWIDRNVGSYQIAPDVSERDAFCFVGNIEGFTVSGDWFWLPAITYFVTDISKR